MSWYYARDDEKNGPLDDAEFQALVTRGVISPETLVWREGLEQWQPFGSLGRASAAVEEPVSGALQFCAECNGRFSAEEMLRYEDQWVCAACKPIFFQRIKEGATLPGKLNYAGFPIRLGAYIIDAIILWITQYGLSKAFSPALPENVTSFSQIFIQSLPLTIFSWVISMAYYTFFVGKFGATLGKMVCGLRIVRPDGSRVSYLRAFGRFWGQLLSGLLLYIGYLMILFDDECRALHDRICDTRVVRK